MESVYPTLMCNSRYSLAYCRSATFSRMCILWKIRWWKRTFKSIVCVSHGVFQSHKCIYIIPLYMKTCSKPCVKNVLLLIWILRHAFCFKNDIEITIEFIFVLAESSDLFVFIEVETWLSWCKFNNFSQYFVFMINSIAVFSVNTWNSMHVNTNLKVCE